MAKQQRLVKRSQNRQHRLAPARHTLAKQGAAVLALGLGLVATAPAEASIVYQWVDKTISDNQLDFFNYQGSDQFILAHRSYPGYGIYVWVQNNPLRSSYVQNAPPYYKFAYPVPKGYTIPVLGMTWESIGYLGIVQSGGNKYGYFLGQTGYIALEFEAGDGTHYAWAQISMPSDASSVTLIDYAYETEAGKLIPAGAVPLPGSLLLLASGAAGLLAYRRMRRAA